VCDEQHWCGSVLPSLLQDHVRAVTQRCCRGEGERAVYRAGSNTLSVIGCDGILNQTSMHQMGIDHYWFFTLLTLSFKSSLFISVIFDLPPLFVISFFLHTTLHFIISTQLSPHSSLPSYTSLSSIYYLSSTTSPSLILSSVLLGLTV
jgi:hypothetical protein